MIDLASVAAGGRIVASNDEFFAPAANLISLTDPVWRDGEYTERGKWMDGWETRRRRDPGHDWCIIALGIPGRVQRVTIDTSHFTGNFPESFSVEACGVGSDDRLDGAEWAELVGQTELAGDSVSKHEVFDPHRVTHVRLNIFPDGGVARFRVEGTAIPAVGLVCPTDGLTDLASSAVGGVGVDASDSYFSSPSNLVRPTAPAGMWDGWETRRRRGPGHDWAVVELGLPGVIEAIDVDTTHFKGNAPGWVSVDVSDGEGAWSEALPRNPVEPDGVNRIPLPVPVPATTVRLNIHPDGGVARLRVLGRPDRGAAGQRRIEYLNSLFGQLAVGFFHSACASSSWVEAMLAARPFEDVEAVMAASDEAFDQLIEADWLEAFAGHPRIGEKGDAVANAEQAEVATAAPATLEALADLNRRYEERFGFTYIVYASGLTAAMIEEAAASRLENTREEELANAAGEQRRITGSRLLRMLCQGEAS